MTDSYFFVSACPDFPQFVAVSFGIVTIGTYVQAKTPVSHC